MEKNIEEDNQLVEQKLKIKIQVDGGQIILLKNKNKKKRQKGMLKIIFMKNCQ